MNVRVFTTIFLAGILFLLNCSSNDKGEIPLVFGEWEGDIDNKKQSLSTLLETFDIPNTTINADIRKDSTYSLFAILSENNDTILKHNGIWDLSSEEDTIYLNGTACSVFDTIAQEWNDIDCGDPIVIPVDIDNNEWVITMDNLVFIGPAIGIDPTFLAGSLKNASITLLKVN
jgi:hypothetical protein